MNAHAVEVPVPAQNPASGKLASFAWGILGYNIAVILWGGLVRATGSGAGCGEHWPLCNGTVVQHSPSVQTMIEMTHRMTSGITLLATIALVVWTFRGTVRRHIARITVVAAAILMLNEAFLGALIVVLGKVARDQSPSRGAYLSLHLANTLLLVAALTLTAHFLSRRAGFLRGDVRYRSIALAALGLVATLFVGVSGSLAALGDSLFPSTSLQTALRQDFATTGTLLLRLRWLHPVLGFTAGFFICWLVYRSVFQRSYWDNKKLALSVIGLLLLQYALGVADVMLLAPVWMQIVHLLGADLLWITLVVLAARLCVQPATVIKAHA
ncbi:MAG TPA: COX15/CtaA family protein [Acidisarcina sp.]|nr:COX15/CtaA family protein [Acidisarcina sp.]